MFEAASIIVLHHPRAVPGSPAFCCAFGVYVSDIPITLIQEVVGSHAIYGRNNVELVREYIVACRLRIPRSTARPCVARILDGWETRLPEWFLFLAFQLLSLIFISFLHFGISSTAQKNKSLMSRYWISSYRRWHWFSKHLERRGIKVDLMNPMNPWNEAKEIIKCKEHTWYRTCGRRSANLIFGRGRVKFAVPFFFFGESAAQG